MFDCHQDEKTFWKTMNPARLHALFSAYFRKPEPRKIQLDGPWVPEKNQPSLYELFVGGA